VRRGALRAGAGDGAVVQREVALRIARAGVEDAASRAPLEQLAFAALRALHAGGLGRGGLAAADLANVAAVGVAGAGVERAVAAALEHHLLAAVLARSLRLCRDVEQARVLGVLALGIAGAGVELPEARALELHRLAALVADQLLALGFRFRRRTLGHLARGLALRIIRAGQELAEAAELDDHRRAAGLALLVRLHAGALDLDHLLLGARAVLVEFAGERAHELLPLQL